MIGKTIFAGLLSFIKFIICVFGQQEDFATYKGPYLDQDPPGTAQEIFASQIITEAPHSAAVFSPNGQINRRYFGWMQES